MSEPTQQLEVAYGGNYLHEGSTYEIVDVANPLDLPIGTILEEVCRGSAWDEYAQEGDSWIYFRPYSPGARPERGFLGNIPPAERSRPFSTKSAAWFKVIDFKPG